MLPAGKAESLIVHTEEPFNAGTPPEALCAAPLTPNELFFVRNHGTIPSPDSDGYRLAVGGLVRRPLSLSLADLRSAFGLTRFAATIQCAGNRRAELMAVEPIPGEVPWGIEAIGTAAWAGVRLRDVLDAAGVQEGAQHVAFTGLDEVERHGRTFGFGGSIPLEKAISSDVLLALEMNDAPLPPTHGFPLRVVVPGYIGARSVKWLAEIALLAEPSDNYFQAHAYKLFPPEVRAERADWSAGDMLGPQRLGAVICRPRDGELLPGGAVAVAGYALPSDGNSLERVELSVDDGATWIEVELGEAPGPAAWCVWRADVRLSRGRHRLVARAHDSAGAPQPPEARPLWNFKGYMNNAWHRVSVDVGA